MEYADFAIICAFFERFGDLCDFKPDTKELMKMLQNTDEGNWHFYAEFCCGWEIQQQKL